MFDGNSKQITRLYNAYDNFYNNHNDNENVNAPINVCLFDTSRAADFEQHNWKHVKQAIDNTFADKRSIDSNLISGFKMPEVFFSLKSILVDSFAQEKENFICYKNRTNSNNKIMSNLANVHRPNNNNNQFQSSNQQYCPNPYTVQTKLPNLPI